MLCQNQSLQTQFLHHKNPKPEWSRHVTIVHQTKDLHTADYSQLYDFLKYNQKEIDELKAERLAKNQDPLALMANFNNPYAFPAPHQDQSSFNQNYLQQPMPNPEDITDPTTAMNMTLALMAKAFKLNYSTPTNNNKRISSNPRNRQIAQPGMNMGQDRQMQMAGCNGGNQFRQYAGQNAGNPAGYNDVIGNQQASTSGTQTNSAPVYDSDGSAEKEVDELKAERIAKIQDPHTRNPLSQKLENENVELEFQDNTHDTSENTKFAKQPIVDNLPKVGETNALSKPVTSNSVSTPQESKGVNNDKVIAPGMFRINPDKTSRKAKNVPNPVRASNRTKSIIVLQPPVFTRKDVNSNLNGLSSTGVYNTKTRRPQPRSNAKNYRVPSASKSSRSKNKEAEVEEHDRNLLLFKNNKHISSACNNMKIDYQDVISKVVCAMCNKCLISVNHDKCLRNYVNGKNSHGKKQKAKVSFKENQKKYQPNVTKPKKVGILERLATPKPRKPRFLLRWSPTGRLFDQEGKIVDSSESESQSNCFNGCSKHMTGNLKLLINFLWKFMGTVCFGNDHVAAILGIGDLQWGNILITRVYFIEGLGHNLFSVGQFCDSDLEVVFRRNACFIRNLEGVYLLKGDRSINFYTINLHAMASASPICLMARASSTKSWLWHQRLSHLNFDTINDLARNDLFA
nr:integrase, catalytic region, zinc finger, CCHC-type, peptidase aspartic, catalytic [Tanacetum cinerariifolium]